MQEINQIKNGLVIYIYQINRRVYMTVTKTVHLFVTS